MFNVKKVKYNIAAIYCITACLLIVGGCGNPRPATSTPAPDPGGKPVKPGAPRSEDAGSLVAESPVLDFGAVAAGQPQDGLFVLKNAGKETLTITEVKSACNCTNADLNNTSLEPGQTVELFFTYTPDKKLGKVSKNIWVKTAAPAQPEKLTLTFTANVAKPLIAKPDVLRFRADRDVKNSIAVESIDGRPFKITGCSSSRNVATFAYDPAVSATKHAIAVNVNLDALAKTPTGAFKITTDHPSKTNLTVPFETLAAFAAYPKSLQFSSLKPGETSTEQIDIKSNFNEPFSIESAIGLKDIVKFTGQTKTDDGVRLKVSVTPLANSRQTGFTDYLVVRFKNRPRDTLKIRCYGKITR